MTSPIIRNSIKIGLITAGIILLFEISNLLLVYKYFKFDYYLSAVAIIFMLTGFFLSKRRSQPPKANLDNLLQTLTNKELHILQLIIEGKTNKEIAAANFVEVSTIKTHINNLYSKLEISSRKEAINKYKNNLSNILDR